MGVAIVVLSYLFIQFYQKPSTKLDAVEIDNYEGKNLSSVYDFRENSIKGPQFINIENYQLNIKGLVEKPQQFSYNDIIDNYSKYKKVVTLNCVEGWSATILWEGILLRDLFAQVQPKPETKTVILRAYDGYSTSFPLSYFYNNDIIMAHKMNGATLIPERGFPFQLVAEDKWGYKWIKWITEIEFSDKENLTGYWEQRGYSDSGDLNKHFLD